MAGLFGRPTARLALFSRLFAVRLPLLARDEATRLALLFLLGLRRVGIFLNGRSSKKKRELSLECSRHATEAVEGL